MIKDIMKTYEFNFKLVFVSSCYSEFVGDIFKNSGAEHVICIKEGETISDTASIIIAKVFYQALFTSPDATICRAFKIAKQQVRAQGRKGEDAKYIMKCDHDDDEC